MSESDLERLSRLVLNEFKRVHDRFDSFDAQFSDLRDEIHTIRKQLDEHGRHPRTSPALPKRLITCSVAWPQLKNTSGFIQHQCLAVDAPYRPNPQLVKVILCDVSGMLY